MDPLIIAEHDRRRNFSTKSVRSICYSPHTSLYFDTTGTVRVCCHNWSHSVGNIASQSIGEIWNGAKISEIRRALERNDFSHGCGYCEWRLSSGDFACSPTTRMDRFPVPSCDPQWPKHMEFSISNICNLLCVMCNGKCSSAIRSQREKLAPLNNPYSDDFFDELGTYLPHLEGAKFLGGEPFLQEQCYRIWDMLIEDSIRIPCHITTNGTVYNSRVQNILEKLPVGIAISLDAFKKETFESIRINAKHDQVLANVQRFQEYTLEKGTPFGLTFCLMRQNWQELADFCLFAEDLNTSVFVNQVRSPEEMSVYALPREELLQIISTMEKQSETLVPRLQKNSRIWNDLLKSLRHYTTGSVKVPIGVPINQPITRDRKSPGVSPLA